jgi:hypothetical protein
MEPFRCLIDRTIRTGYNLKQVSHDDFLFRNGQYDLDWKARKKYLGMFTKVLMDHKEQIFGFVK